MEGHMHEHGHLYTSVPFVMFDEELLSGVVWGVSDILYTFTHACTLCLLVVFLLSVLFPLSQSCVP